MLKNNTLNKALRKLSDFIDNHEIGDEYDYMDLFELNEIYNSLLESTKEQMNDIILNALDHWMKTVNKDDFYTILQEKDKKEIGFVIGKSEKTAYRKLHDHSFEEAEKTLLKEYYGINQTNIKQ